MSAQQLPSKRSTGLKKKSNRSGPAPSSRDNRRWLRVSEAAEYLGVHQKTIYRACGAGRIPAAKAPGIGIRIDKYKLDELLANRSRARG